MPGHAASPAVARQQLEERRELLHHAIDVVGPAADLQRLVSEVDAALARLGRDHVRMCVVCDEPLEEALPEHPMARYCLCDLDAGQRRELEYDLETASAIQTGLLPPLDLRTGPWSTHYRYLPAGAVSGDVIDLAPTSDGALMFLLGDVAGKGVSAALLMSHLAATFHSHACARAPLDDVAQRLNTTLVARTDPARYATLVVGRAHVDGRVEIANAGHVPPVILRHSGAVAVEATGLPAGLFDDAAYSVRESTLDPGETLVVFSDGLTEATDTAGEELGFGRVADIVSAGRARAPHEIASSTLAAVAAHQGSGRQHDDQTILTLRRESV